MTTAYTVGPDAWTDLGLGPAMIDIRSGLGQVLIGIGSSEPASNADANAIGDQVVFNTNDRLWAKSPGGSASIVVTPIAAVGGGSGITASALFTPVAAAYGAGDVIDVPKEFAFTRADGSAVPSGSLIRILTTIVKIDATALVASEAAYTLQCYSVTPPSAQADNAAWTLASADLASYRGSIAIGTPVDLGAALYVKTSLVDLDIKLTTSSLWARLVTVAGFTIPAVDRQVLLYGVEL